MSFTLKLEHRDFPYARRREDLPGDTPVGGSSESDVIQVYSPLTNETFDLAPGERYWVDGWKDGREVIAGKGLGPVQHLATIIGGVAQVNQLGVIYPAEMDDFAAVLTRWGPWQPLEVFTWASSEVGRIRQVLTAIMEPNAHGDEKCRTFICDIAYVMNGEGKTIDRIG